MALSLLITQCLQQDFVGHVNRHEPLPNRLHVGYSESLRLLGADQQCGPVAQVMNWARAQDESTLEILHIRDWHDKNDPAQRDHLAMFGDHCLKDTPGAKLVLGLDDAIARRKNEQIIDSLTLNDFSNTDLGDRLAMIHKHAGGNLRVGVVGVWTDAKVSFLLYELKTRCGLNELATCSALTASSSRTQHFNALDQLSRILGVKCFESLGEFVDWLNPGSMLAPPANAARFAPRIEVQGGGALNETDTNIVGYLYRDSSRIQLTPLSGGFSGALVFKTSSQDSVGHQQAPSVCKLGPAKLIGKERVSFEKVEEILGNNAPSVRGFVDFGERAGIKYSYAAMGQDRITTLKALFEGGAPQTRLDGILRNVFDEVLGPFYAAARYERLPLLEHYGFKAALAPRVRELVTKIVREKAAAPRLKFHGGYEAENICAFYEQFLPTETAEDNEYHYVSYVHGDLNGANVLIDSRENVWVIDYFHTAPSHVLKDIAKLENDLLYIFTPLESRSQLAEGLLITQALRDVQDLQEKLPKKLKGLTTKPLVRAWNCIRTLREIAARLCGEDRHPLQMKVALLRYAVHTLSFDESSALQKEWALAAACGFAEDIAETRRRDRRLRVDWLDSKVCRTRGRIGLTICPGRRDRGRNLGADLDVLAEAKVARLLCLTTHAELEWAGAHTLSSEAEKRSIHFWQLPIADQGVPSIDDAKALVRWVREAADAGQHVAIHCMGGLGRTGTVAACTLASLGVKPDAAIAAVRTARGPRAVETVEQEEFVAAFAKAVQK